MNRLIFGTKIFEGEVQGVIKYEGRECYRFTLTAPYADIVQYFIDGASYIWEYDTIITDEQGIETPSVVPKDLTALGFTKAMDIIDKRNGTFWVYMGKETTEEKLAETELALEQAILASVGGVV